MLSLTFAAAAMSFPANLLLKVTDGSSVALEDASIVIPGLKLNQLTDDRGICVFKNLPGGKYTLFAILPGFEKYSNTVELNGSNMNINISMKAAAYSLGEINVESKRNEGKVDNQTTVKKDELYANSQTVMNDSVKTLQLMPGVSSGGGAANSAMFIQGGNSDEWIAYMDGIYIQNPMRWNGYMNTTMLASYISVSMFNPYVVDSIDLYTAGYPAIYGQGLSGVVAVDTVNGSSDRWKGFIDVSLMAAEILAEGPVKSNLTVVFDMRRTYYDLWLPVVFSIDEGSETVFPYLWDGFLKLSWDISPEDRLSFDGYFSLEGMDWSLTADTNAPQNGYNYSGEYEYQVLNVIGSAKYYHNFGTGDSFDIVAGIMPVIGNIDISSGLSLNLNENFSQYFYQLSSDYYLNSINGHKIQAGGIVLYDNPSFGNEQMSQYMLTPQGTWTNIQNINLTINNLQAAYYAAYLMDNWEILPSFILELGGREEYYTLNNEYAFNPQGGIKWESTENLDFYIKGGLYHEYPMNILELNSLTGNPDLQSEKVYHAIAGLDYSDSDYMFRIEGFYKYYYDLDETDSLLNINNCGIRNVYGGDVYIQKKPKKGDWLSGWISYTYVKGMEELTNRSPEDPANPYQMPLNQQFVPAFLISHTISALVELTYYKNQDLRPSFFDFMNEWKFSAELTMESGIPYTPVTNYTANSVNGMPQYYFYNGAYDSMLTPWYCKLDLKLTMPFDAGWLKGCLGPYVRGYVYIEVLNALNYNNILSYNYSVNNGQLTKNPVNDLPLIPLGGFRIEF
jgi:outer membrane cobalamin receptor